MGTRLTARVPVTVLETPDVTLDGSKSDLVDFYSSIHRVYFLSERLAAFIEHLDPGSLEGVAMEIRTKDGAAPYRAIMPARRINAVDPARTDVSIGKTIAGFWYPDVNFPNGIVFRSDIDAAIHNFSDQDTQDWYWSRELIDAVRDAGMRGLETVSPMSGKEYSVDLF